MIIVKVKQGLSYLAIQYELQQEKMKLQINMEWDLWAYIPYDEISEIIFNHQIYHIEDFLSMEGCCGDETTR